MAPGTTWDARAMYDIGALIQHYLADHPAPQGEALFEADFASWADRMVAYGRAQLGEAGSRPLVSADVMAPARPQVIGALLDAEEMLSRARDEFTTAVVRQLQGCDDPAERVEEARLRVRLATGAANAALDQALAKGGA